MTHSTAKSPWQNIALASFLTLGLSACGAVDRLKTMGQAPDLTPMEKVETPERPHSLSMQMPVLKEERRQTSSLWRTGAKAFFKDQRAASVGDIVTVMINITDQAKVDNTTSRSRTSGETVDLGNILGFQNKLDKVLPGNPVANANSLADFGSTSKSEGAGTVDRSETINMTVAAIVSQILPNGNMVIQGRQEVRVNFEVRELLITGIIRPEDISNSNTIQHTQIAEARVSYGGRGQLTELQQNRWGTQLYEILFPF